MFVFYFANVTKYIIKLKRWMFKLRKLHFRQQQKKNKLFAVTGFLVVLNLVNKVGNLTKHLNTSFNVYN